MPDATPGDLMMARIEQALTRLEERLDKLSARVTDAVAELQALRQWLEARP